MISTKTFFARVLSVGYLFIICFLCFYNWSDSSDMATRILGIRLDKILHFVMYCPYAFLAYLSWEHKKKGGIYSVRFTCISLLIGLLFAGGTEVIQNQLPYREMDINDFYANALGIICSSLYILAVDLARHAMTSSESRSNYKHRQSNSHHHHHHSSGK